MIPEIDIWRAATLMLRRYDDKAIEETATRADQLARRRRRILTAPPPGADRKDIKSKLTPTLHILHYPWYCAPFIGQLSVVFGILVS
jgi:hypothetical protein